MTAWRMASSGRIAGAALSPAGRWMVEIDIPHQPNLTIAYARVSSHAQKPDLDRQVARIAEWAASSKITIDEYVREIGSGLNDKRKGLGALLENPDVGTIIVEHRDRLARFGVNHLERVLKATKRKIVIIEPGLIEDDLVRDMIDLMTCFSARLYGRRSATNRAKLALKALEQD